jgi:hypothetical protein
VFLSTREGAAYVIFGIITDDSKGPTTGQEAAGLQLIA